MKNKGAMLWRLCKALGILVAAFGFAAVAAYLALTRLLVPHTTVVVPDLLGKEALTAIKTISDQQLNAKVVAFLYDDKMPADHVLYQDPEARSEIRPGRDLRLTISRGPRRVIVPDLSGLTLREARVALENNHLKVASISLLPVFQPPFEVVLGQDPPAHHMMERQHGVSVLIGQNAPPPVLKMPQLLNQPIEKVQARFTRLGLPTLEISYQKEIDYPSGQILEQSPLPGWPLDQTQPVQLVVSKVP